MGCGGLRSKASPAVACNRWETRTPHRPAFGYNVPMPQDHVAVLSAELEAISSRLIAVTNSSERAAMLDEMRAILQELQVLIQAADSELPADSASLPHSRTRTNDFPA